MPEEAAVVTTPTSADNDGTTTTSDNTASDPREGASKGIVDRLNRLEQKFEKERLAPVLTQLEQVKAKLEEQGLDLALFGFEASEPKTQAQTEAPVEQPVTTTDAKAGAEYLQIKAAYEAGLPQEVLPLITATDEAGIAAQVQALAALRPRGRRIASPVPATSQGTALPTFRQSQLSDGDFFVKNKAEIMRAMAEGRIIMDR